jgi:hypothetical protein
MTSDKGDSVLCARELGPKVATGEEEVAKKNDGKCIVLN